MILYHGSRNVPESNTCTYLSRFYSLAASPELVEELREEIRSVLADNDGTPTTVALQHMKKLDSFLKEVLRIYPATMGKRKTTCLSTCD